MQDPEVRAGLELVRLRDTARNDPSLFLSSVDSYPAALTEKPLIQNALSQLNADEAGAWIARHPAVVDAGFVARTAAAFFEWNRDQAIAWVGSLAPGEAQNRALASLASQWTDSGNATQAASTIAAITDPRLQTSTRFQVFNTLYRKDRAAAVQWLGTQPLAPEIRANWETIVSAVAESGTNPVIDVD
ncbi:MAG: hypothetical protein IPL39_08910 [Opitutaceae bacterium]|nr:hypothetical protein [Opitutaceae bacterium]